MKYNEVKRQEQKKYDELLEQCGVFWAFSKEQFLKNKTPLKEGEKYASIGAGGFMPKSNFDKFIDGTKSIEKWCKVAVKDCTDAILYELNNYECFYTGDITDAMPRLKELGYTLAEVKKVYKANYNQHEA
jgi:hypothetical protein